MTRFYDENNLVEISLKAESGEDFSSDIFEDVCNRKNYSNELNAFRVDSVEDLIYYANNDTDKSMYDLYYSVESR